MSQTSNPTSTSFHGFMLKTLPKKIGTGGALAWEEDVAAWWGSNPDQFASILPALKASLSESNEGCLSHEDIQWALCTIPSFALFDEVIPNSAKGDRARSLLKNASIEIEEMLDFISPSATQLALPLSINRVVEWSRCGSLPLAVMATRMGRGSYLAKHHISISAQEAKGCIYQCIRLKDLSSAVMIFENCPAEMRIALAMTVWRGINSYAKVETLPSLDPPSSWWDKILKETKDTRPPQVLSTLIKERPHLSEHLAAAMLRSGLQHVDNLARATPGLSSRTHWANRDGMDMVALGVVVDSWAQSIDRKIPNPSDLDELASKSLAVVRGLPDDIVASREHMLWQNILQGILDISRPPSSIEVDLTGSNPAKYNPTKIVDDIKALAKISYLSPPGPSLMRWVEIACLSLVGSSVRTPEAGNHFIQGALDLLRIIFMDLYLPRASEGKLEANKAMEFILKFPYEPHVSELPGVKSRLEWEIWTLFTERCQATSAWTKNKILGGAGNKTLRNIAHFHSQPTLPEWPHIVASRLETVLSADEDIPRWFISILQKESMRTQGGANEASTTTRTRL